MSKKDFFEVGLKLVAVYILYACALDLYAVFAGSSNALSSFNGASLSMFLGLIIRLFFAWLFVFKIDWICKVVKIEAFSSSFYSNITAQGLLRVGIILMGMFFSFAGIQSLVMTYPVVQGLSSLGARTGDFLMIALSMVFFGLVLIAGAKTISELLIKDESDSEKDEADV